jgi:hypothetical protein
MRVKWRKIRDFRQWLFAVICGNRLVSGVIEVLELPLSPA